MKDGLLSYLYYRSVFQIFHLWSGIYVLYCRGIYFAFCAPKGGGKVFKFGHAREEFLVLHHKKFFPGISQEKLFPKNLQ